MSNTVITNPVRILAYTDLLAKRNFVIYRLLGEQEFLTSDNPVMLVNTETEDATPFTCSFLNPNMIVFYPLTPKLLVSALANGKIPESINFQDGCIQNLDSKAEAAFISRVNKTQLQQCYSQIYAHSYNILEQISTCQQDSIDSL